jgi:3-methyl-2-oxobutanoate hydroxymethyltransferase
MGDPDRLTVPQIRGRKGGEKIVMLTAYDYLTAQILDRSGVDILLIGDTLGPVFQGRSSTLPVTLDETIYHTRAVARGSRHALVISDMPFLSFQVSPEDALRSAGRCLKEGNAQAVKMEGGKVIARTIRRVVEVGIPVMGHIGLTPQSEHKFGGYKMQGGTRAKAAALLDDARSLEEAGVFAIVVESVPEEVGAKITETVSVPTIGIGAGRKCDGQVLVTADLLGLFTDFQPGFVRRYAKLAETAGTAVERFARDVKDGKFPGRKETRRMKDPSILKDLP